MIIIILSPPYALVVFLFFLLSFPHLLRQKKSIFALITSWLLNLSLLLYLLSTSPILHMVPLEAISGPSIQEVGVIIPLMVSDLEVASEVKARALIFLVSAPRFMVCQTTLLLNAITDSMNIFTLLVHLIKLIYHK